MGIVKYDADRGFYRSYREQGLAQQDDYGTTLELARAALGNDIQKRDRLRAVIQDLEDEWRGNSESQKRIQFLTIYGHLLNEVFPNVIVQVLDEDVRINSRFRTLIEESYRGDYEAVVSDLSLNESELQRQMDELGAHLGDFTHPISYRDSECRSQIYVLSSSS